MASGAGPNHLAAQNLLGDSVLRRNIHAAAPGLLQAGVGSARAAIGLAPANERNDAGQPETVPLMLPLPHLAGRLAQR